MAELLKQLSLANLSLVDPPSALPALCKHWAKLKICLHHDKLLCKFSHPKSYTPPSSILLSSFRKRKKGGRLTVRNDNRVQTIRKFIYDKLGDTLQTLNVLDVAGGKGEFAFHLMNLTNVKSCTVIDPRNLNLKKYRKKLERGIFHRSRHLHPDICLPCGTEEQPIQHLPVLFEPVLWVDEGHEVGHDEQEFEENLNKSGVWTWPTGNMTSKDSSKDSSKPEHVPEAADDEDDDEVIDPIVIKQTPTLSSSRFIVKSADLIVGCHPDQAVDAIIDCALALNVSFFTVPCCTYSSEFPKRRFDDKPVTTFENLLDYLQAKSPDIMRETLGFEGKNVCLYRVVEKAEEEGAA